MSESITAEQTTNQPIAEARGRSRRHRAVLDAEVRRLRRELRLTGPLPRSALARLCDCGQWREGSFEEAVSRGIATGRLRALPFGFVAAAPPQAGERASG